MPHKRAKRATREEDRKTKGSDLAPRRAFETQIPKRMAWVLGSEKKRQEWREKKRKAEGDEDVGGSGKAGRSKLRKVEGASGEKAGMKIMPGETLGHFNRRVEDNLRSTIRAAAKSTPGLKKRKRRAEDDDQVDHKTDVSKPQSHRERKTEFEARPSGRRLNDIVMAPPTLTKKPRRPVVLKGKDSDDDDDDASARNEAVVGKAHKRMMEAERERVIKRYREMKERKRTVSSATNGDAES